MSRLVFWNEDNIIREIVYMKDECRYKTNSKCFNNKSKKLGTKCYGCEDYVQEDKENGTIVYGSFLGKEGKDCTN